MKFLLALLLTFLSFVSDATPYSLPNLRRHYQQAAADKQAGETFYKLMAAYQHQDAVVLGYKAAAEAIKARDASFFDKLPLVQAAARTFEQAVRRDPGSAEVRFLRLSVESNLPAFLGLSQHVEEDRQFLLQTLLSHPQSGLDAQGFGLVRGYLVERGHVSTTDAQRLEQIGG